MVLSLSGLMDEWSQARTKKKIFGADGSSDTVGRMCGRDPDVLIYIRREREQALRNRVVAAAVCATQSVHTVR